ncbi:MAG TPA: hypothetical protein GX717_07520 [Clostridiaceae bacterium]|nr:hypothetical protein [Clostridiaceae bacterium]
MTSISWANSEKRRLPWFRPRGITLIIGGSGSGKSVLGEMWSDTCRRHFMSKFNKQIPLSYIATLAVGDDPESKARVRRHRAQRADYGFTTYEIPLLFDLSEEGVTTAFDQVEGNGVVLLDCLGNLVANQMFAGEPIKWGSESLDISPWSHDLSAALFRLARSQLHTIIVSNHIFSDAISYDEATMRYRGVLGILHQQLAEVSDQVVEAVYGKGIFWKGGII